MNDKKIEAVEDKEDKKTDTKLPKKKKEIGGADGPEPTRFGDWEKKELPQTFLEYLRYRSNFDGFLCNLTLEHSSENLKHQDSTKLGFFSDELLTVIQKIKL